jgi:hypothetical protein
VLALLFVLHRENGDFSTLMKGIWFLFSPQKFMLLKFCLFLSFFSASFV